MRVYLKPFDALGDTVCSSAVVLNMYDAGIKVNVHTYGIHDDLWSACPVLDKTITETSADCVVKQYKLDPMRDGSPSLIGWFTSTAARDLGIQIPVKYEKPVIWMQEEDPSPVHGAYVLINTGYMDREPTKRWSNKYWTELVKSTPDILFVQMGMSKNHAVPIPGAVSFIDKTPTKKELFNLVRHAKCVITHPSGVGHIASAYGVPVILLVGAREPAELSSYPEFTTLSSVGCGLSCCAPGDRCFKHQFNHPRKDNCSHYTYLDKDVPTSDCMTRITPDMVSSELKKIFRFN